VNNAFGGRVAGGRPHRGVHFAFNRGAQRAAPIISTPATTWATRSLHWAISVEPLRNFQAAVRINPKTPTREANLGSAFAEIGDIKQSAAALPARPAASIPTTN